MDKSAREQLMQTPMAAAVDVFDDAHECDPMESAVRNEIAPVDCANIAPSEIEVNTSKRRRDAEEDASGEDEYSDDEAVEDLLLFLPSIQCNCSSWDMKDVPGDLIVTSIRVLFIASAETESAGNNDIAIDGRCIALHAVDSESPEKEDSLSHVYCQLSDPGDENNDAGFSTAMGFGASTNVMDEDESEGDDNEAENNDENTSDSGVVELYFKPMLSEYAADKEQHVGACQRLFDALTKLASLNPVDDSDCGGGGLFDMFSLMADMGEGMMGIYGDSDNDEMVVRLGGSSNNIVEDDESGGAPEDERQRMLDRLDNMLVVPPEYEIRSDDDEGQFDDADEDDNDLL